MFEKAYAASNHENYLLRAFFKESFKGIPCRNIAMKLASFIMLQRRNNEEIEGLATVQNLDLSFKKEFNDTNFQC